MARRGRRQAARPTAPPAPVPRATAIKREVREQRRAARESFEASGLRRAIVLVVAAKVAAIVLLFDPFALDVFDLPKSLVSRIFEWALVGLLAGAILRHGHEIVPRSKLHFFVGAFVLANVISAFFAQNTYVAIFGEKDRYEGLTFLGDMLVLYLAIAVAFRDRRDWATLLVAFGGAAALSLAYAGLQVAGLDPIKWALNTQGRPFGTLGHPDMFGHFLSVAFAVALGHAVVGLGKGWTRALPLVAAILALVGMGVVATRGSALGIAAAILVLPVVALRARILTRPALVRWAAAAAVIVVIGLGLLLGSQLGSRLRATLQGYAVADRIVIYENALSAFRDKPITGWGPDAFAVAYPHYQQPGEIALRGIDSFSTSAHDWPLETAATTGVLGLGTLLALIGAAVVLLWRRGLDRMPEVAVPLIAGAAAYWASGLVSPNALALDWIGWVVFGGSVAITGARVSESAARARVSVPVQALAYGAAAIGIVITSAAFSANREAEAAQTLLSSKQPAAAIARAQAATASDGGRVTYWPILGAADQQTLKWRGAVAAHGQATARAPYVEAYWVNLARSYAGQAASGDDRANALAAAIASAKRGTEVSPNEPMPHATLAQIIGELGGDQALARAEITRAIALYQNDPQFDQTAVTLASQGTDPRADRAFLEALLQYKDSALLRFGIAETALHSGDRAGALDNVRKALELDPNNPDAKALLASLGG